MDNRQLSRIQDKDRSTRLKKKKNENTKKSLTLVQYPKRGENDSVSLLEKQRHPVAANQGHPVPALSHCYVSFFWQDILQVRLNRK